MAIVLLVAVAARLAVCRAWSDDLAGDPDAYLGLAQRLAAGEGYVSPDGRPTAFRPPLYPLLLAGVVGNGGLGVAILHIAMGFATVWLTCDVGRRLGLGWFALPAGMMVAIDPLLLRYTPRVMTETTCALLAIGIVWVLAIQRESGMKREPSRWKYWIASAALGLVMGFAVLSRPTFWVVLFLVVGDRIARTLLSLWRLRNVRTGGASGTHSSSLSPYKRHATPFPLVRDVPPDSSPLRVKALGIILVIAGLATVVAPWVIRNAVVMGEAKLTTTHGGYTLLLANNPVFWNEVVLGSAGAVWEGDSLAAWQAKLEKVLAEAGIDRRDEFARDRWMRDRAIQNIRNHPGLFVRASLYRLSRFWDVVPLGPGADGIPAVVRWTIGTFYALTLALALCGLVIPPISDFRLPTSESSWIAWCRDAVTPPTAVWRSLLWLILGFTLVHAVYWTDTRMRAPLVPVIALLAAGGLRKIVGARGNRKSP